MKKKKRSGSDCYKKLKTIKKKPLKYRDREREREKRYNGESVVIEIDPFVFS